MDPIEWIGWIAGGCTMFSFFPQALHVWKQKSARGISMATCIAMFVGAILWMIYGIAKKSPSLIWINAVVGFFVFVIMALKFRFDVKKTHE